MIADPYKVLGIDPNASDADLKKAYRDLSKKYHPDANPDNPAAAEERFKEIQEAYRQIVEARERGTSAYGSSTFGSYSYGGQSGNGRGYAEYGGFYGGFDEFFRQWQQYSGQQRARQEQESTQMQAARNYINNGYYREAMTALEGVPESERGARWYYYRAHANAGLGNNIAAMEDAKRATDLEPENGEYAQFLQRLQNGGQWYQQRGANYGGMGGAVNPAWCLSLCAVNMLCNCCRFI